MEIKNLRNEIDDLDRKLVQLLLKRLSLCKKIGKIKNERGFAIEDLKREMDVLNKLKKAAGEESPAAEAVFKVIMEVCKKSQDF